MCVRLPAAYLEPGTAETQGAPMSGLLHIGRYPSGIDATAAQIGEDLAVSRPDAQPCSCGSHCPWHHAGMTRLPHKLVGVTRMKCAGTPSIHGSSPASIIGARSASVSR